MLSALAAALLAAGLRTTAGIGLRRAAASARCSQTLLRRSAELGNRNVDGFEAVLSACQCAHDTSVLESDSYMLSGLFLLKQLMPKEYAKMNIQSRVDSALHRYVAPKGDDCGSIFGEKTMAQVDFWYFTGVQSGFGALPSAKPSDAWVQCLIAQLPGGAHEKKPAGPLQSLSQFITAMELQQVTGQSSGALAKGAEATVQEAEGFFSDEACRPGGSLAELCGYYYTHRMLKETQLMTRRPEGEAGTAAVWKYAELLRNHTVPYLEGVRQQGALPMQAVDLAGEVAFCLKAIALAGDADPDVRKVVELLREAGAPAKECHSAVTFFFGTAPSVMLGAGSTGPRLEGQ